MREQLIIDCTKLKLIPVQELRAVEADAYYCFAALIDSL